MFFPRLPSENIFNTEVAFIQAPELDRTKIARPDSVVDLLQPDLLRGQSLRDVHPARFPAHPTVGADITDLEMVGVLQGRHLLWIRLVGRRVEGSWWFEINRLMWTQVIGFVSKIVEPLLLSTQAGCRRASGFRLESSVHAFMAGVLLRMGRLDQLREDAQSDPPHRELRQAGNGGGGKGHAVIRAHDLGKAVFFEQPDKERFGILVGGRVQPLASEQKPAVAIGHS